MTDSLDRWRALGGIMDSENRPEAPGTLLPATQEAFVQMRDAIRAVRSNGAFYAEPYVDAVEAAIQAEREDARVQALEEAAKLADQRALNAAVTSNPRTEDAMIQLAVDLRALSGSAPTATQEG